MFLAITSPLSYSLEIALTFDDAPSSDGYIFNGKQRTDKLIEILKKHNVSQTAFFCNTTNLSKTNRLRLNKYAKAGHIIANHTESHKSLSNVFISTDFFIKDIKKADQKLSSFSTFKRYIRFPYLRGGMLKRTRAKINDFLEKEGYKHGYITIETYDWQLNELLRESYTKDKKIDLNKVKNIYLDYIWHEIEFYDTLAKQVLNRSPKHVILFHENDLHALFLGDLIELIKNKGGKIITVSNAYQDPIANKKWDYLPSSQNRIKAIAKYYNYPGKLPPPFRKAINSINFT